MSDAYILETCPYSDDNSSVQGAFTTRENAATYAERIANSALDWGEANEGYDEGCVYAHVRHPLRPGADYHEVDAYYITRFTLDPAPEELT